MGLVLLMKCVVCFNAIMFSMSSMFIPEQWCADQGWSYPGCDEYEILGCTDDGMQDWSPFQEI